MTFEYTDWIVVALYFLISFSLGLFLSRRGGESLSSYFLSGRKAPWWLAGTGMVATTFAADTPLAVAGLVGNHGVAGNWIWWCSAAGGMMTVFFFARLWRRSGVLTDLEFIELRYSGRAAAALRGFKAVYFGLLINAVVIGWVNLAMVKIFTVLFPSLNPTLSVILLSAGTAIYVIASGLWGIAAADAFQFFIAMGGTILLAVYAVHSPAIVAAGGMAGALPEHTLNFFPVINSDPAGLGYQMPLIVFLAFMAIQWWASWYPGAEPGGGGYIAQRIMSARNEREGFFATLWFVVAHYCLRPWPWIMTGLAALILYPDLPAAQKEEGYVYLMRDSLPSPAKGLLIAAFLGAYMSTLATQLNWGASYLLNDLYRRFLVKKGDEKSYLRMARVITILILILSLYVTFNLLETISGAWEMLLEFGAGSGFVLILRWYWWRINAISEFVSMLVPAAIVIVMRFVAPLIYPNNQLLQDLSRFPISLYFVVGATVLAVMITVVLTPPERPEVLQRFYNTVRPPGPGWRAVSGTSGESLRMHFIGWISGTVMIYSLLFLTGSLLLGRDTETIRYALIAAISTLLIIYSVRRLARD
jgi:SSS family solute:Na+ symporter